LEILKAMLLAGLSAYEIMFVQSARRAALSTHGNYYDIAYLPHGCAWQLCGLIPEKHHC
jgi:hypothetical protein